jgi:hypothetical protein
MDDDRAPKDLVAALGSLPGLGLDALAGAASLQHRRDRKYIVPVSMLEGLFADFGRDTMALEIDKARLFRYESIYFDTTDLESYRDAARSRPRRRKVRTRAYLDSGACALEVKTRDRNGQTIKHRLDYPLADRHLLNQQGGHFIAQVDPDGPDSSSLQHTLTTSYLRATLLIDAGTSRATVDVGLRCTEPGGAQVELAGHALLETKSVSGSTSMDRLLWANHVRPVQMSKYCVGLAALQPELGANKWNRILRTHFGWRPTRSVAHTQQAS